MNRPLSSPAYCRPQAYLAFAEQLPHLETTRGLFRTAFAIAQPAAKDKAAPAQKTFTITIELVAGS